MYCLTGDILLKLRNFKGLAIWGCCLAALLAGPACNKKKVQQSYVSDCSLPDDQSATLSGRWPITPIKVGYQAGAFTQQEIAQMSLAVQNWNQFYNSSKRYPLFDDGAPNHYMVNGNFPNSPCAYSAIQNNQFVVPIAIFKETSWAYTSGAIAVTTTCPMNGNGMPSFFMGAIQLNYQYFMGNGLPVFDSQSILLHELGHLAGLKHSCEFGSSTQGIPDCNSSINGDYKSASLYPKFGWNGLQGEVRRSLNTNDQSRANCIYQ